MLRFHRSSTDLDIYTYQHFHNFVVQIVILFWAGSSFVIWVQRLDSGPRQVQVKKFAKPGIDFWALFIRSFYNNQHYETRVETLCFRNLRQRRQVLPNTGNFGKRWYKVWGVAQAPACLGNLGPITLEKAWNFRKCTTDSPTKLLNRNKEVKFPQ